uniref:Cytochrome P450 n=1 Tax=Caenorhabditis tropicalis TaxID=1561998 RepID=A0A1I7SZR7_9PELO
MGGYPVYSGTFVTAQLSALHINQTVFDNPKEFDPERFIRDEKFLQKVVPFEVGKKSCFGEALLSRFQTRSRSMLISPQGSIVVSKLETTQFKFSLLYQFPLVSH